MPMFRRAGTLALSLLAVLAACDGPTDPSVGLEPGTFQIEVSGDTAFALTGYAGYRSPQMVLTTQATPQQTDFFQLFVGVPASPGERRYEVMPLGGGTVNVVRQGSIRRQFAISAGTLEMDRVTADHVEGTAQLMADEMVNGQRVADSAITLRVTFNAARARL